MGVSTPMVTLSDAADPMQRLSLGVAMMRGSAAQGVAATGDARSASPNLLLEHFKTQTR